MAAMPKNALKPLFWAVAILALPALAQLPQRNLTVELRQIDESEAYTVSTQATSAPLAAQQVQVRNGEKATLQMGQSMPIRFVQSVAGGSSTQSGSNGSGSSSGGGVSYGMVWMQAGQSMTVQPRWPGAKQPVTLQIDVQAASVEAPSGNAELPTQARSQVATTVSAPLGQWVTVAATGAKAASGSYSSEAVAEIRRLVQIRVLAP
jgi:hypothetical protein